MIPDTERGYRHRRQWPISGQSQPVLIENSSATRVLFDFLIAVYRIHPSLNLGVLALRQPLTVYQRSARRPHIQHSSARVDDRAWAIKGIGIGGLKKEVSGVTDSRNSDGRGFENEIDDVQR